MHEHEHHEILFQEPAPVAPDAPLLLVLHGRGRTGRDLAKIADDFWPGARAVLPSGPFAWETGRAWYERGEHQGEHLTLTRRFLRRVLADARERFGTPLARTAVVGFSQGAVATLDLALTLPADEAPPLFVALSGYLYKEDFYSECFPRAAGRRVLLGHGLSDDMIAWARSQDAWRTLERHGLDAALHLYATAHGIVGEEVADVRRALARAWGLPEPAGHR